MTWLQAEESALSAGRMRTADKSGAKSAWNYAEFRVLYPSLAKELCVGDIYIKLLLEGLDQVCGPSFQVLHQRMCARCHTY